MAVIEFDVWGAPVGKGRPRFARAGAHVRTYTPAKTASYERVVSHMAAVAMAGRQPMTGAVEVEIEIRIPIPPSWPKAKREAAALGLVAAVVKPDADNVLKICEDGMVGVVFVDDKQVVDVVARKRYGATPGVRVRVREIELGGQVPHG